MEAPIPKMSGLVRKNDLFSKAFIFPPCFRAPWNCRSIEEGLDGLAAGVVELTGLADGEAAGAQHQDLDIHTYIHIYIYIYRERERFRSIYIYIYIYT